MFDLSMLIQALPQMAASGAFGSPASGGAASAGGFQQMLGNAMQGAGKAMSPGQEQTHPTGPGAFVNPDMVDPNFQAALSFMEANAKRWAMMGGQR